MNPENHPDPVGARERRRSYLPWPSPRFCRSSPRPRWITADILYWSLVATWSRINHCWAWIVSDSALPFAAGILWEQAFGGQRKPLPRVWSLPNNVVNLGASIRGDARIGW